MHRSASSGAHRRGTHKMTGRTRRAVAIGTAAMVAMSAIAAPAEAIMPINAGAAGGTTIAIDDDPGEQLDPHVSGDLVAYTDASVSLGQIRFYDMSTGVDQMVPAGTPGDIDALSDVNGTRIALARQHVAGVRHVVVYDTASGTSVELDPPTPYSAFATAIAGDTVAFLDNSSQTGDIVVADVSKPTAPLVNLSTSPDFDGSPNIAPDGKTVVWESCNASFTDCDVRRATRTDGTWGAGQVVAGGPGYESNPDVDGVTMVYQSDRPSATGQDVYLQPAAGGIETQLSLPGIQRDPGISQGVVSFETKDTPVAPADLFVYEIASNRVLRITDTPTVDESLNDISVLPNGDVRLVWAANDDVNREHNIYARTLTLPAADPEPPAKPGDILVVDPDVPPLSTAVLFRVDPQTGARSVLSDFGSSNPNAVAVEANGNILVTDNAAGTDPSGGTNEWGALHRIDRDPTTGDLVRTILTDFGVGPNTGRNPVAVTVEPDGHILVLNGSGGSTGIPVANRAVLVRIDPVTGTRTILSDFGDIGQGSLGVEPRGVTVEANGSILVIDAQAGIGGGGSGQGELVRIDRQTGVRTSLANFGAGPLQGSNPTSVAVEESGQILVTDEGHPSTTPLGLLYRIDPLTGARTILSDFNTGANTGREPEGVALEADGTILVVDKHAGPLTGGQLFRIDPQTGARAILSDFGVGANRGNDPLAVAVVPGPSTPPRATLVVINRVIEHDGGSATSSQWTVTVDGANPSPSSFAGTEDPGTTVTLDAGPYSVTAAGPEGYSQVRSVDCAGTIGAGETRTCTITNDDDDGVAPTIHCDAADGGWHATNVSIDCAANDDGSGLVDPADAAFSLATSVAEGTEDGNASTGSRQVCDVTGNCTTAGPIGGNKIDRNAPTLVLPPGVTIDATSPAGAVATFAVSAFDGADPNPALTCDPPGEVFAIGMTTVTCTASDHVGNGRSGSFVVTVLGAREQLARLVNNVVAASGLRPTVKAQLLDYVQPIVYVFDPSNPVHRSRACGGLRAFIIVLSVLSGRGVPPSLAAAGIADGTRVRAVIGC